MVKYYGTAVLVLMTGLSLTAWGCDEQFEAGPRPEGGETAPGALSEQPAAESDQSRGLAQPKRQFDQPDGAEQVRPLEAPEPQSATPPSNEPAFSAPAEQTDSADASPEPSAGEAAEQPSTAADAAEAEEPSQ